MLQLREGQEATVRANLRTRAGHRASYQEGSVTWETSDPDVATVTVNPDNELEAKIRGVNGEDNGSAAISFRADGDPDADQTRDLVGTVSVVVTLGEATVVELQTDAPVDTSDTPTGGGGATSGEPTTAGEPAGNPTTGGADIPDSGTAPLPGDDPGNNP